MGNRANVVFTNADGSECGPCVYLHWNGGPESIYRFIDELDRRSARDGGDLSYETARFIGIVAEFFDQETRCVTSLGVTNGPAAVSAEALGAVQTDAGDNGFYVVARSGKERTVRRFRTDYTHTGSDGRHDYPLREVPEDLVEQERAAVYASRENEGIGEFFLERDEMLALTVATAG